MRPGLLLFVVLTGAVLVGAALWLRPAAELPPPVASAPSTAPTPSPVSPPASSSIVSAPAPVRRVAQPPEETPPETESVAAIMADLKKPDADVRQAALQRARDLGDRSIIPRLRQILPQAADDRERQDILDTIDFINLPSIDEVAAEGRAARGGSNPPPPARKK